MTPEQIKALKTQVEAHYKGKERSELLTDITNMSEALQDQFVLLTQLDQTKSAALAVADSVLEILYKEGIELPADLVDGIKTMHLSNFRTEGLFRITAHQYGAAGSRKEQARKAVNARHDQKGGYRDARAQVLAIWAAGDYLHHTHCAKAEHEKLGIGYDTAYDYLTNAPNPDPWPAKEMALAAKKK